MVNLRNIVLNNCMKLISNTHTDYNEDKLEIIRYGLESIFILITKVTVILLIATFLHLLKEVVIFMCIYTLIRMPSFGLHATKSWMCWISSGLIFLGVPIICNMFALSNTIKAIICAICICRIYKNAPADTYKRPIINKKRREKYKFKSTVTAVVMSFLSLFVNNMFVSNCFILALVVQCFIISPYIYRVFNLPYDNYKQYEMAK